MKYVYFINTLICVQIAYRVSNRPIRESNKPHCAPFTSRNITTFASHEVHEGRMTKTGNWYWMFCLFDNCVILSPSFDIAIFNSNLATKWCLESLHSRYLCSCKAPNCLADETTNTSHLCWQKSLCLYMAVWSTRGMETPSRD